MKELKWDSQIEWTGERVIVEKMKNNQPEEDARLKKILYQHLARYYFAASYCFNKIVLDASCGTGYGSSLIGLYASSVLGVDVDEATIDHARDYETSTILFKVCDLDKNFPEGNFDTVLSFETIEHLKDPNLFLANVAKHAKTFIFSIPVNNKSEFHLGVYSVEDIQKLLGKYFQKIKWYKQVDVDIEPLDELSDQCRYLIGITS